jgi:hypothetical protein
MFKEKTVYLRIKKTVSERFCFSVSKLNVMEEFEEQTRKI